MPAPLPSAAKVDDNGDAVQKLRVILEEFYGNPHTTTYEFPPSLSSKERFLVHEVGMAWSYFMQHQHLDFQSKTNHIL